MGFIRRLFPKNFLPADAETARKWNTALSAIYAFTAWNAFAITFYYFILKPRFPDREKDESSGSYYSRILNIDNRSVNVYKGFTLVDTIEHGSRITYSDRVKMMREKRLAKEAEAEKKKLEEMEKAKAALQLPGVLPSNQ